MSAPAPALAGLTAAAAFVALTGGDHFRGVLTPAAAVVRRAWHRQQEVAEAAQLRRLGGKALTAAQAGAAIAGGVLAFAVSGLPAVAAVGAVLCAGCVRGAFCRRASALRRVRQDATVEAVRTLRQLLETGAVGVQQALIVLAQKGPPELRAHFAAVGAAVGAEGQRRAWIEAGDRLAEPLFDMLAAAVLVQRPAGGELAPLFIRLEESVTAVYEVTREAEALGVQARSAAALILCLPLVFLAALSMLRSPYLDVYRQPIGQGFLALMLLAMGASYLLIVRWLRVPRQPRLQLGTGRG